MQDQSDSKEEIKSTEQLESDKIKEIFDGPNFLKPNRLDGESLHQYKVRRLLGNLYIKNKEKGQFMWISKDTRMPIYAEGDTEKKTPIGYQVSKGFTYDKAKVKAALEKFNKEKQEQSNTIK